MRWLPAWLVALAGCAAVELEAEEPVEICRCNNPANHVNSPRSPSEEARWRELGEPMVAHSATLGAIFDRTCPTFDTSCLVELDAALAPHARATKTLRRELHRIDYETCGGFTSFYALDTPATPDGGDLIRLLRAGDFSSDRLGEAAGFISGAMGVRSISCCYTLEPVD